MNKNYRIPTEIQNNDFMCAVEDDYELSNFPAVHIFYSFDLVNSTAYKSKSNCWYQTTSQLFMNIIRHVEKSQALQDSKLWKTIGDKIVFMQPIYDLTVLGELVEEIFRLTQLFASALKSGQFHDNYVFSKYSDPCEIENLKKNNDLSLKSTAWLAIINSDYEQTYDTVTFKYASGF